MRLINYIPVTLFFILFSIFLQAQQPGDVNIGKNYDNLVWSSFVKKVETTKPVRIFYYPDSIREFRVSVPSDSLSLQKVLDDNLTPFNMNVITDGKGNFFIYQDKAFQTQVAYDFFYRSQPAQDDEESQQPEEQEQKKEYMNTYDDFITKKVTIGSKQKGFSSNVAVLSGYVTSSEDSEPIPQATLQIEENENYTTTNDQGFYRMKLPKGKYTLSVTSIGSHEKKFKLRVYSSDKLNIALDTKTYLLKEAVITSNQHHNVRGEQMGFEKIRPKTIKDIPVVLGEQDITKVATLLPGVQTMGEASSGFNVRGSPADQNMFYLDDVPIYNITHLFGFFSAFNSDAVNEFSLYKSNIPIKYGGRLSSIFDVEAKKGNSNNFSARGGISPVTSRAMVEGPIKQDKSSYLIGVRSTYSDWVLNQVKDVDIRNSEATFSDAVANFSFTLNENNKLNLLGYGSKDNSDLAIGTENRYSNAGGIVKWEHDFNKKLESKLSLIHSEYDFTEKMSEIEYSAYKQSFDLKHSELRLDFEHNLSETHNLNYGYDGVYYQLHQGDYLPLNDQSEVQPLTFEPEQALKNSVYIGDKWEPSRKLSFTGGLRFTTYHYLGPKTVFQYPNGLPREKENIIDTVSYGNNETVASYNSLDYRLAGKYMLDDDFSVKASYNKLHQYMFLLTNTVSISPTDKWKLTDSYIEPMSGEQYSIGFYKNFLGMVETSLEFYLKDVENLVEYEDGAEFLKNEIPETEVLQGDLEAYGMEVMIKKPRGKVTGWLNYTYSKAEVTAFDKETGEQNNFGRSYPANYDKPHAFNASLTYKMSKRFSISSNVVYSTGRPITYPTSIYYQDDIQITGFSLRNEYRLPDYFRVDLSLNFEGNLKKEKLAHGSWSLSFYNLTARRNAYSVYFKNVKGRVEGYKLSIFGTIIPSISYNFKLGNYND